VVVILPEDGMHHRFVLRANNARWNDGTVAAVLLASLCRRAGGDWRGERRLLRTGVRGVTLAAGRRKVTACGTTAGASGWLSSRNVHRLATTVSAWRRERKNLSIHDMRTGNRGT